MPLTYGDFYFLCCLFYVREKWGYGTSGNDTHLTFCREERESSTQAISLWEMANKHPLRFLVENSEGLHVAFYAE